MKHFDEIKPSENDNLTRMSFAMRYNAMTESSEKFLKFFKDGDYLDIEDSEITPPDSVVIEISEKDNRNVSNSDSLVEIKLDTENHIWTSNGPNEFEFIYPEDTTHFYYSLYYNDEYSHRGKNSDYITMPIPCKYYNDKNEFWYRKDGEWKQITENGTYKFSGNKFLSIDEILKNNFKKPERSVYYDVVDNIYEFLKYGSSFGPSLEKRDEIFGVLKKYDDMLVELTVDLLKDNSIELKIFYNYDEMIDKFLRILKSENLNLFVVIGQLITNYPKIFKGANKLGE
jgi:hypothetical protein